MWHVVIRSLESPHRSDDVFYPWIQLPDNFFFQTGFLLHLPGYQVKPVKGSSKILDFNMCPCYYVLCFIYVCPYTLYIMLYISEILNFYTPDSVSLASLACQSTSFVPVEHISSIINRYLMLIRCNDLDYKVYF